MDRWIIDSDPGVKFPAWTRGNAADVFPEPVSPLMATLYLRHMGYAVRDAYVEMGVYDYDEMEDPVDPTIFAIFGGYAYNPLSLVRLFGARMPGASPEAIDKAFFDERPDVPPYEAQPWHESERHAAKLAETAAWVLSVEALPELDRDKALADSLRAGRPDLATLDPAALLARARAMVPFLRQVFDTGMLVSTTASIGPGALGAICEALGDPTMAIRLLAGIEADSAEPPKAMWALSRHVRASSDLTSIFDDGLDGLDARLRASSVHDTEAFVVAFDDFLFHFGSRGPNEWDILAPTWEVRPEIALAAIDRMRFVGDDQSPAARRATSVAERERVLADVRTKLAADPDTLGVFEAALRSSQLFLSGRERYKTNSIKIVGEIRMAVLEVGRQMVARGHLRAVEHVFMLLAAELDEFQLHPDRFGDQLAARYEQHRALYDLEPPFAVNGYVAPLDQWRRRGGAVTMARSGDVLTGVAGASGVATGRARVILDPTDPTELEPGDVLVAPQTDPSWAPLFVPAAAVIVNVGALGSHAMIVSRELGIPCVASVADATARIPRGALVTVDGNAGTVTIH
jgi:pyruvate,water dikinase